MKGIYWRAQRTPTWALSLVAMIAALGVLATEHCTAPTPAPDYDDKINAARLANRAFDRISLARLQANQPIDLELDPQASGLIGTDESPIVSNYGHLPAKRSSINPNFAAVVVDMLNEIGASDGDAIAVGMSGSFPAINISVYAALQTLGLEAFVISSGSSSEFGATLPGLTWFDMERVLNDAKLLELRSIAGSLGGDEDEALRQHPKVRSLLTHAMARNGTVFLDTDDLQESIKRRTGVLDAACDGCKLVAYINVGGGEASLGPKSDRKRFAPGINRSVGADLTGPSVALNFLKRGVPVIHLGQIEDMVQRYGLVREPRSQVPVGDGEVYREKTNRRWFALGAIFVIILSLHVVTKLDWVQRLAVPRSPEESDSQVPQQMV